MKFNIQRADIAMSVGSVASFPRDPRPQVALSGRSNVGKSSLINTLLGRKSLARVSSAPGKTVTVNFYDVDHKLYLVDLPGYGFAKRSRDAKRAFSSVTEDYFLHNPSPDALRLVVQLVDARTGLTEDDCLMVNFLLEQQLPFLIAVTKTDKLSKTALAEAQAAIREQLNGLSVPVILFSSVTRAGREELLTHIAEAIN